MPKFCYNHHTSTTPVGIQITLMADDALDAIERLKAVMGGGVEHECTLTHLRADGTEISVDVVITFDDANIRPARLLSVPSRVWELESFAVDVLETEP